MGAKVRVGGVWIGVPAVGVISDLVCDESIAVTDSATVGIETLTYDIVIGDTVVVTYDTSFTDNTPTVTIT